MGKNSKEVKEQKKLAMREKRAAERASNALQGIDQSIQQEGILGQADQAVKPQKQQDKYQWQYQLPQNDIDKKEQPFAALSKQLAESTSLIVQAIRNLSDKVDAIDQRLSAVEVSATKIGVVEQKVSSIEFVGPKNSSTSSFDTNQHILYQLEESLKFYKGQAGAINKELLLRQVNFMSSRELDQLSWARSSGEEFWTYYTQLGYPQMAIRMVQLILGNKSTNTIKNNFVAFKNFSNLFKDEGIQVLGVEQLRRCVELVSKIKSITKRSTFNQQLAVMQALAKKIYGLEITMKVQAGEISDTKHVLSVDNLQKLINAYRTDKRLDLRLLGFCIYLLFISGERNETVRTVAFDQFRQESQGYYVILNAAKTKKAKKQLIPEEAYKFVQAVYLKRMEWVKLKEQQYVQKSVYNLGTESHRDRIRKLIDRRKKYLFTFFTQSALHKRIKQMKLFNQKVDGMHDFIVHSIRTLRIRDAYVKGGIQAAMSVGQHAKVSTTMDSYLRLHEREYVLEWGDSLQSSKHLREVDLINDDNLENIPDIPEVSDKEDDLNEDSDVQNSNSDDDDDDANGPEVQLEVVQQDEGYDNVVPKDQYDKNQDDVNDNDKGLQSEEEYIIDTTTRQGYRRRRQQDNVANDELELAIQYIRPRKE